MSTPPPQKVRSFPNSLFKPGKIHVRRGKLHRAQNIHSDFDQVGDQVIDGSAAVQEELRLGPRADKIDQLFVAGFDEVPVHLAVR